jgi:tripartite-type tricarboxylate transporter receptor subunit TctC
MKIIKTVGLILITLSVMMQAKLVRAEYPESTVKVVVGFPPGQATDVVARFLSQKISENIPGSNFIVENKPGASGILGARIVAGSQPDGLTLMMGSSATLAVNPALYKDLPYDVKKDFAPIGLTVTVPLFMVVTPNFPAKTVQELVDMARKAPGTIDYGSGGSGVTNHLAMEMFKQAADIKMTHIPYKGGPAAITDLMAGRINVMFETSPAVLQHIKDGRLRALAVSSSKRASAAPEIPTIAESGFPGFEAVPWIGLVAPAGTPQPIIDKLSTISMKVLREKDFVAKLQGLGADPVGNTPAQFAAYIDAEMKRWAEAVKMSGAKID